MKIMLLMTTYAKNYASTIYQSLFLGVRNISSKSYRGSWGWDDQQFGGSFHTSQIMGDNGVHSCHHVLLEVTQKQSPGL